MDNQPNENIGDSPADLCTPCKSSNIEINATSFCPECEEDLCYKCTEQHGSRKATRLHKLIPIQDKREIEKEDSTLKLSENLTTESSHLTDVPGKPVGDQIKADTVTLVWGRPGKFEEKTDYYQISFKEKDNVRWKFFQGDSDVTRATTTVTDLKANTEYIFRVRVVNQDGEGKYSEESEVIKTVQSPAAKLVQRSTIEKEGNPSPTLYRLPINEVPNSRDTDHRTKKFEVGEKSTSPNVTNEKTIMLVGATGTGKSTFVDGLVNYVLGVNWSDHFRFTIIDLEDDEKAHSSDQSQSLTDWITVYTINPDQGGRLSYTLNIIDTPGFGDTRGLHRDQKIVEQIRALFSAPDAKGVQCIDAICFLIKAPDARLTATQTYIFQQIMAIFGKDVEENICSLITFADGQAPPVLAALSASKLPFGKHFTFNNSALFANNTETEKAGLSPMFWEMGVKSFYNFFRHLSTMNNQSLQLTKKVLDERKKLEISIQNLQPQVDAGLSTLNTLNTEITIISQHELEAAANKDFEYEVVEQEQVKHELPKGEHTTYCLHCKINCHKSCVFANDDEKRHCAVMDKTTGKCTQCENKCIWSGHVNSPYIFEFVSVKKKKTYQEKLDKYKDAEGKVLSHQQLICKMEEELVILTQGIESLMQTVKCCNERLNEIALRPHQVSMAEHIETMIKAENFEKKKGYNERIAMLEDMKQRALTTTRAETFFSQIGQQSIPSTNTNGDGKQNKESKPFSLFRFLGDRLRKN